MQSLLKVVKQPSGWDSGANYMGEYPDPIWDSLVTQTRDSGTVTRSNFAAALEILGGESEDVQIFRYGHWACGWWEALAVKQGTPAHVKAQEIADALEDYPVVDDEHLSELEMDEANMVWRECYTPTERIKYIRDHRSQFDFNDWRDLRSCVRGDYFAGYASELCQ